MASAQSRGWGAGWPTNRLDDMIWVKAPLSGAKWQVHHEVAPLLAYIVAEAERRGYLFDYGPKDPDDDWGYANRPIAGTRSPSNHSWGLAVDIDASRYPQGQRRLKPPDWLVYLFGQWGWSWGGGWSNPDPMHFEVTSTPAHVRQLVAMLAASHVQNRPIPVPPGTPSPLKPPTSRPLEDPMQIIHVPDAPNLVNPDTWFGTNGISYRPLAPGEPDWLVISGLVPTPNRGADGSVRPVPMPYRYFTLLSRA